ncbi:MAG: PAS domain S-box protein [Desulfobulbus sp.]|nr:PAS domain S-box protein [Desulfobulbus sp.]
MKYRFHCQHIVVALLATLILAGLFYLPYLAARNKTIETFRGQQSRLAQQTEAGLQEYTAVYRKALIYLVQQPAIQAFNEEGKALLRDFLAIHPQDIAAMQRLDATGASLFAAPEEWTDDPGAKAHCRQIKDSPVLVASDLISLPDGNQRIYFSAPVHRNKQFDGCLSFSLPLSQVANRYLKQIPWHHDTSILLFSQDDRILAAPEGALVSESAHHLHGTTDELASLRAAIAGGEQSMLTIPWQVKTGDNGAKEQAYAVVHPVLLSGNTHWSMVLLTPVKDVLGAMAEFRSQWLMVTGITAALVGLLTMRLSSCVAKRREEQWLQAEQEQLAALLDLAPLGVFLVDGSHTVLHINREARRMIGADDNHVLGRSFIDFLHCDSQAQVVAGMKQPWGGQAVRMEAVQFVGLTETVRDVVITAPPYHTGAQPQCLLLLRDVTEERRSAARQRRLIEAIDQVQEAVLIADCRGTIDYVNATLGRMTGYTQEECHGHPVQMLWAKEQDTHLDQEIGNVVEQGTTWQGRIVNQRKDGSRFVAAVTVSSMRDLKGDVAHFVLAQRDITHDVQIESRMQQAQKMEAIGTLAGGIAHDFNNILGGIIGFTDMALLLCAPETAIHNNLLHIRQGGKRAADLVQQILTFSRQSVMEKVPVPVASLIKESLNLMRATLPVTIDIRQDLLADDATVMAAPVQIQQIIMNLCTNACYAMREKGGTLTIRLERTTGADQRWGGNEEGRVMLVVEDTGQGIERDILPNIFTPFFSTKEPGEGTGMGLSVVYGIVRELGGEISVQSQPNQGSAFMVLLPEADQDKDGHLARGEEPLPVGSEHILVVDDEKEIRETCRMMLTHLGYTVTTTDDPQEVLALVEQSSPPVDLVLTDQTMPKMTGIELTEAIRRLRADIPVILYTGYSDQLNHAIALEAGACDLLMKPMDLRGLGSALRSALDRRQAATPNVS